MTPLQLAFLFFFLQVSSIHSGFSSSFNCLQTSKRRLSFTLSTRHRLVPPTHANYSKIPPFSRHQWPTLLPTHRPAGRPHHVFSKIVRWPLEDHYLQSVAPLCSWVPLTYMATPMHDGLFHRPAIKPKDQRDYSALFPTAKSPFLLSM